MASDPRSRRDLLVAQKIMPTSGQTGCDIWCEPDAELAFCDGQKDSCERCSFCTDGKPPCSSWCSEYTCDRADCEGCATPGCPAANPGPPPSPSPVPLPPPPPTRPPPSPPVPRSPLPPSAPPPTSVVCWWCDPPPSPNSSPSPPPPPAVKLALASPPPSALGPHFGVDAGMSAGGVDMSTLILDPLIIAGAAALVLGLGLRLRQMYGERDGHSAIRSAVDVEMDGGEEGEPSPSAHDRVPINGASGSLASRGPREPSPFERTAPPFASHASHTSHTRLHEEEEEEAEEVEKYGFDDDLFGISGRPQPEAPEAPEVPHDAPAQGRGGRNQRRHPEDGQSGGAPPAPEPAPAPLDVPAPPPNSHYATLAIDAFASEGEIKRAFHKMSKRWHPDKNPHNKEEAEGMFYLIKEAYELLSDPESRALYDLDLMARGRA